MSFTYAQLWTAPSSPIDTGRETALLALAQSGDAEATLAILVAYRPAMLAVLREFAPSARRYYGSGGASHRGVETIDRVSRVAETEDLRSSAVVGVLSAIEAWDGNIHPTLAGIVRQYVTEAVARDAATTTAFAVPERTLKRFFGIARRAGYDLKEGARLAPDYEMTSETFRAIWETIRVARLDDPQRAGGHDEYASPIAGIGNTSSLWEEGGYSDIDDKALVKAAFAAVDGTEKDVCALAYGFSDYDPVPDAEVAHRLGLSSRLKALRVRRSALTKMRDALGVDPLVP